MILNMAFNSQKHRLFPYSKWHSRWRARRGQTNCRGSVPNADGVAEFTLISNPFRCHSYDALQPVWLRKRILVTVSCLLTAGDSWVPRLK